MPETHISEWAQQHNVSMDRLYATELREGGTRAVGTGIPAVARESLNALPLDQWERDKEQFVYETWINKAKELVTQ